MFSIDRIRADLEEFTSLVDEEHYLNGAGLKDKAEFTRIYEKFGHLFNKETIDFVREYSKTVEGGRSGGLDISKRSWSGITCRTGSRNSRIGS